MPSPKLDLRQYRIQGMDCAEEVSLLRRELSGVAGVRDLKFDILQARLTVEYDPRRTSPAQIEAVVARTGMRAEPWSAGAGQRAPDRGRFRLTAVSGAALLAAMAVQAWVTGEVIGVFLAHDHEAGHGAMPAAALILYLAAAAAAGWVWGGKAWASLRRRTADMNALVAFSVAGAMVLGEWSEAAVLAFLFALAGRLESWSVDRARESIARLLRVAPAEATVIHRHDHDGHEGEHEHRTPVEAVAPGSLVRVKPGERIPFDGMVETGRSFVDQALITGESVPVEKGPGAAVYAGTINQHGMLEIRTARAASGTLLARMVRMVEESRIRRSPSEQQVERFARGYAPAVLALAVAVAALPPLFGQGAWGEWFYRGMVVLLFGCPCALVISTPVSFMAALASAAQRGVLVKGGAFLEEAARLRALAIDKTAVLTRGEPSVTRLVALDGRSEREVLEKLAGLEASSEHPLGRAILRYAAEQGVRAPALAGFQARQGLGAVAESGGAIFWAGSARMLRERVPGRDEAADLLDEIAGAQHTVVACGMDNEVWALLALADPPRPEARQALETLRRSGVKRLAVLSGDSAPVTRGVAASLGLDDVRAELLPEEKAEAVRALRDGFQHVGMVGDGVNDAPALAEASVGIAAGWRGADVAMETADIVLMQGDLRQLPFLVRHARRAVRIVRQNIALALGLKLAFLAAGAFGAATLWLAVAADMGATFLVILNGLRLLRARD